MPATAGWTVEELWKIPDDGQRREIIDGELFVSPSPAWSHQYILGDMARSIHEYLRRYRIGKILTAPADAAEYWIVDGDARLIERWRAGDERPEVIIDRLEWHPAGAAEPFVLDIQGLFASAGE